MEVAVLGVEILPTSIEGTSRREKYQRIILDRMKPERIVDCDEQ
jgi:hypothetical protein